MRRALTDVRAADTVQFVHSVQFVQFVRFVRFVYFVSICAKCPSNERVGRISFLWLVDV